ncbi:uncharacterized protein LOC135095361 isoform X3 [Scylla paramamosain]|uniref:uncharacterized protein LOC135095361 isoform X3 n=1 Tax=Scylla paramamosain TaxID=85552 RepID=UPI003083B2CB
MPRDSQVFLKHPLPVCLSQCIPASPRSSQSLPIHPSLSQCIPASPRSSQSLPIHPSLSQSIPASLSIPVTPSSPSQPLPAS